MGVTLAELLSDLKEFLEARASDQVLQAKEARSPAVRFDCIRKSEIYRETIRLIDERLKETLNV
jgi:hypothetical protein